MKYRAYRIRTDHAKVQISNDTALEIAQSANELDDLFYRDSQPKDMPILLFTGAKGYCRDGGWWDIMGYAPDGSDVQRVLDRLEAMSKEAA
jgi:hypothetical protein